MFGLFFYIFNGFVYGFVQRNDFQVIGYYVIGVDVCVVVVDILFFECVVEGVDDGLFNF